MRVSRPRLLFDLLHLFSLHGLMPDQEVFLGLMVQVVQFPLHVQVAARAGVEVAL